MALSMPGPDSPRRRVKRPKAPKTIVPMYARRPYRGIRSTIPGFKGFKTNVPPRPSTMPAITTGPSATAAPTGGPPKVDLGKYGMYAGIPGAINALNQIDTDQAAHQDYVNKTVAPWLSAALTGLAGFNTAAQNSYLGQIQGNQAAAAIAPTMVSATGPGGIVAGDNSYLTGAGQQYAAGMGKSAQDLAAYQTAMAKMQPTTLSQGYINALADYAKGLPALYSERRAQYVDKLNGYLADVQKAQAQAALDQAKLDESIRHNKVQEATSALNAQNNLLIAASRLGLDASKFGADQASAATAAATPSPSPNYIRDPATGKLVRDYTAPTYSAPKSPKASTKGQYDPNTLAKQGFVGGWKVKPKKLPAGAKSGYVQGTDGKWYVKPGTAKGASAPTATQIKAAQGADPNKVYDKLTGYQTQGAIAEDQATGTGDLLRILRSLQPTDTKNFAKWYAGIIPVLRRIDPRYEEWMTGYIKRRKAGQGGVGWHGKF